VSSAAPLRFLHTGDLHLDSPVTGLITEAPPEVLAVLRGATTDAWRNVIRTALDEHVDFVLVAGDVFEQASPTLLGQTRFRDGLAELADAGIASYVVHGNHDPMDDRAWAPSLAWPARVHRFGTEPGEWVAHERDGVAVAHVHGRSYPRPSVTENYAAGFRRQPGAPFSIGLLHANVGDRPGHGNYAPCSVEDLRSAGMDYWALGHIHQPSRILDDPPALYCGITQGRDPGELGARGCWLVDAGSDVGVTTRFVATDVVRWAPIEVSIDALADDDALLRAVREAIGAAVDAADDRSLVIRLALTGRGPLHPTLRRPGYLDDLRLLLNEDRSMRPPFAWVESIRDATRAEVDLDARRDAPDFVGDFLRTVATVRRSSRTTDPDEHEHWRRELRAAIAPLFADSPRGRRLLREVTPSDEALVEELLVEAEALGIDLLVASEEAR
jgi:DNA repair protein SbcD/Mre11